MHPIFARQALASGLTTALSLIGLAAAGPAAAEPVAAHATTVRPAAAVRTVGPQESGNSITLTTSRRFRIELPTAVDGGYRWVITRRPNHWMATVSKPRLTPYPHPAGAVGYPYRTTYVVTAIGTGTTRITLVERGPGTPADIAQRFTLRLHVLP